MTSLTRTTLCVTIVAAAIVGRLRAQDSLGAARTLGDSLKFCYAARTTWDAYECQVAQNHRVDDSLNLTYNELIKLVRADAHAEHEFLADSATIADTSIAALRRAERAWIAFRTAECGWRDSWKTGSMYIPIRASCYEGLTLERNRELRAIIDRLRSQ